MLVNCGTCPRTEEQSHSRIGIDIVSPKTFNAYPPVAYVHTPIHAYPNMHACIHTDTTFMGMQMPHRQKCMHSYMGTQTHIHACVPALASTVCTHTDGVVFKKTCESRQLELMDKLKHQTTKVRLHFLYSRNLVWVWHTGSHSLL